LDKWLLIKKQFEYWIKAQSNLYIHSPFVFEFYNEILKPPIPKINPIEALRTQLKQNNERIEVTDFGAGSHTKSNLRKISEIAKNATVSRKFGYLLNRLIALYKLNNVLELGTNLGLGTAYLAMDNSTSNIISIEGCPRLTAIAKQNHQALGYNNIKYINAEFGVGINQALKILNHKVDLAYLDGNHQYQPTVDYFNLLLPHLNENSILVFDDIYWSKGMMRAWQELKAKKEVRLSIDLYRMGLLFFKTDQAKEHFVLKF